MLERVAHFTILSKLGQGGMGVVFKAQDSKLQRAVALKLLPPEDVADPERRARFVREARAAASVTHPNIATIYEIGTDEAGRVFIAMELVEGKTLREQLATKGPFSVADALARMREITRGLAKAHAAGLVHRDLKPDNLMVGTDGTVKILDFGLAKMRELTSPSALAFAVTGEHDSPPITKDGIVVGTPGYMSPEQATGQAVDARSDIFSLGVVFFEMLAGKMPFRGATVGELIVAVARDEPRGLRELAPNVPEALARLIGACLAKSPENRPKDAQALLERLSERFEEASSDVAFAKTEHAPVTLPPPKPRRRALSVAAMLLGSLGALWLVVALRKNTAPVASVDAALDAGVGLLDLPPPEHCNEAARAEYRAGLEASRGRGMEFGRPHYEAAIKADPQCAEAHLRAALHNQWGSSAREHYNRAALLRDRLGEHDRELLDAYAPFFTQEPPNFIESKKRLDALIGKRPRDAEVIIFIGYWLWGNDPRNEMEEYGRRALAIDPGFSSAWQLAGVARMKNGDNEGARQAFEECDRTIPTAIDCVYEEARLAQAMGRCTAMETHSRTLATRLPSGNRDAYELLARALAANDVPRETVAEALRQAASDATPDRAALAKLEQARLAIAYGDFDRALSTLAEVEKAIDASDHLGHHVMTTQLAFELNLELGRPDAALAIARTFDNRQRAWSGSVLEFFGSGEEGFLVIPRMLGLQLATGKITAERRDVELATWIARRETVGDPRVRWIARYAASAQTTKDAEEAVAVMPRSDASGARLAPILGLPSALIGRVLARGGRPEEGIEELQNFTQRCERLDNPIAQTQAFLWLGEALESAGRGAEACAKYAVVRSRWSDPRSASARRAEERIKALGCAARDL